MDDPLDTSMYRGAGMNDFLRGIPVLGDLWGGLGVEKASEVNKKRAFQRVQRLLAQYRPEQLETRQNALDNAMQLFQPVNKMLVKAYGQDASMPIEAATKSPFSDRAMADMRSSSTNSNKRPYYFPASEVFLEGKPSGVTKVGR